MGEEIHGGLTLFLYLVMLYFCAPRRSGLNKTIGSHRIYGDRGRLCIFLEMGGNRRLAPIEYDRGSRGEK